MSTRSGWKPDVLGIPFSLNNNASLLIDVWAGQQAKPSSRGAGGGRENAARASVIFVVCSKFRFDCLSTFRFFDVPLLDCY